MRSRRITPRSRTIPYAWGRQALAGLAARLSPGWDQPRDWPARVGPVPALWPARAKRELQAPNRSYGPGLLGGGSTTMIGSRRTEGSDSSTTVYLNRP